jgi:superkiller protein 3
MNLLGSRREEAYSFFIASLKQDPTFAAAFTSLGYFYADFASPPDPVRASKCFQKAFELDPRESSAARKLAEGFAEDREWDLVEVVARRTIEGEGGVSTDSASTVVEFIPTNSWAWKAVGLVETVRSREYISLSTSHRMLQNRENYLPAIQAFQNVLRAEPGDSLSWSRLGEAYAKAGRHAAAIKALYHALELDSQNWLCSVLIAELKSQIGLHQEAIPILEELLTQRPDELSVLVALAQAHFSLGRTQFQGGYHIRAEDSFLDAIEVAMLILDRHPGFRGVSWKIISDATLQLCFRTKFQNESRIIKVSSALSLLLSKEDNAIPHSPSPAESSSPIAFLNMSIQACHLRVALNHSSNIARGAAWYDLATGLKVWCKRVPDVSPETKRRVTEAMTKALKEELTNELYWSIYGNIQFPDHPKIAQHAYIKALEMNSKV